MISLISNLGRAESVWERPQALKELDDARMAATTAGPPVMPAQMIPPMVQPNINVAPPHQANVQGNVMFDSITGAYLKPEAQKSAVELAELEREKKRKEVERKKKEEEAAAEKNKQNAKPLDKSRPVCSTPISGTPW
jgi:transcription elongation regulator 1